MRRGGRATTYREAASIVILLCILTACRDKASDHDWVEVRISNSTLYYACALDTDGAVYCTENGPQPPKDAGPYTAVAPAGDIACALRASDGGIDCWGDAASQVELPGVGGFTKLAVSFGMVADPAVCAVSELDGVSCWGDPDGEYENGIILDSIPSGTWTDVELQPEAGVVSDDEGDVACWGAPVWPDCSLHPDGRTIIDMATDFPGVCVVYDDGSLECGLNDAGDMSRLAPVDDYAEVSLGYTWFCARNVAGQLGCWGRLDFDAQVKPPPGTFTQLSTANYWSCAVGTDAQIQCWGFLREVDGLDAIATAYYGP